MAAETTSAAEFVPASRSLSRRRDTVIRPSSRVQRPPFRGSRGAPTQEKGPTWESSTRSPARQKQAAGDLADDASLRRQGKREERKGEKKDELDRAQERADEKADEVADLERKT
jgi:uncharacterized protein YjbJ (UPF0337 family)